MLKVLWFLSYCLTPNIQMHYVDIITAQKKQENPREDRKAVTFISYFLVLEQAWGWDDIGFHFHIQGFPFLSPLEIIRNL